MINNTFRPAIAMIELIFAIVVMGIVLLSAPTLIGVSSKSSTSATFQESIYEVASLVNLITTRHWDENNTNSRAILHIDATANPFPGKIGRIATDPSFGKLSATGIGQNGLLDTFNDMDDFNNRDINISVPILSQTGTIGEDDYIDVDANLHTQVQYGKNISSGTIMTLNNPFAGPIGGMATKKNIKLITVTLSSQDFPDKNISLSTFACNIGAVKPKSSGVNR